MCVGASGDHIDARPRSATCTRERVLPRPGVARSVSPATAPRPVPNVPTVWVPPSHLGPSGARGPTVHLAIFLRVCRLVARYGHGRHAGEFLPAINHQEQVVKGFDKWRALNELLKDIMTYISN